MTNQLYYGDNLQALRDCTSMNGRSYSGVMVKEERPYHIQAIYDLKADYSPEHFRFAIGECRKVIAQLIAEDNSSDQQVARVHILRYLDLQLSRAVRWAEDEADLMAVVLRSQIELRNWAEFVSTGPKEAAAFLHEVNIDIQETPPEDG